MSTLAVVLTRSVSSLLASRTIRLRNPPHVSLGLTRKSPVRPVPMSVTGINQPRRGLDFDGRLGGASRRREVLRPEPTPVRKGRAAERVSIGSRWRRARHRTDRHRSYRLVHPAFPYPATRSAYPARQVPEPSDARQEGARHRRSAHAPR